MFQPQNIQGEYILFNECEMSVLLKEIGSDMISTGPLLGTILGVSIGAANRPTIFNDNRKWWEKIISKICRLLHIKDPFPSNVFKKFEKVFITPEMNKNNVTISNEVLCSIVKSYRANKK